jgi:hypothetical protein
MNGCAVKYRLHLCPADIWTEERLEAPAIGELISHGGSRDDLSRLREHFRKRAVEKYQAPLIPDENGLESLWPKT